MAYDSTDLDLVLDEKRKLLRGERVSQVRSASGKTLIFQDMTLADMNSLENEIRADLARQASTKRRSRSRGVLTSKGL